MCPDCGFSKGKISSLTDSSKFSQHYANTKTKTETAFIVWITID